MNTSLFRFIVLMCLLTGAMLKNNHAQTSFPFDSDTTRIEDPAENFWDKLLEKKTTDDFDFRFRFITSPGLTRYSSAYSKYCALQVEGKGRWNLLLDRIAYRGCGEIAGSTGSKLAFAKGN